MSAPQIIRTPSGEELVVLPRAEYEALLARANHKARMPTTSPSTMLGRPNWVQAAACCSADKSLPAQEIESS
jgi:hypothetical protein